VGDPYFDRRPIGRAEVTLIASVRGWRFRPPYQVSDDALRAAAPDADEEGRIRLDHTSAHIAFAGLSVVIDPGRVNAEQRARYAPAVITPGVDVALRELGIAPDGVTHVVITHHHHDHFSGITREEAGLNVTFPNARHLISRADWESVGPHADLMARHWQPVLAAGLVDVFDDELEITAGLRVIALPGETKGHAGVQLESAGESFYWVGDLMHHEMEVRHLDWALAGSIQPAMEQSRRGLLEAASSSDALVAFAHARFPGWGRVRKTPQGYRWTWVVPEATSSAKG
jgi:glyoxylase-like metal-dependent hydrolase (beta-lactamase superfamily II)